MGKTKRLEVRITPDEHAILREIAQRERLRPSELIRWLIRSEGRTRGLWPPPNGDKMEVGNSGNIPILTP
jgi:hypothetical protein